MRLLGFIICAVAFVVAGIARAENIKIGVLFPYSGPNADLGDVADKALDLYVKLHAKDILPHKVELIKRDEGPPSGANAKRLRPS
jgi:branched-chain amino acid transport system substrate-binding protein